MPYPIASGGHEQSVFSFVDAALNGKPAAVPGTQVILTLKIIDGLFASARTGKEVTIK